MTAYPIAVWEGWTLRFLSSPTADPHYVVVFCVCPDGFLLVDIPNRGWTTPSGRVEPYEDPEGAARREAIEEAGCDLGPLAELGSYQMQRDGEVRRASLFVGPVMARAKPAEGPTCIASVGELPEIYHGWNPLFRAIFDLAWITWTRG